MYEYSCKIKRIIDGDSLVVDIDLGFDIHIKDVHIRVIGIDTPEIRTRDRYEKFHGLHAKAYLETLIPEGSKQILRSKDYNPTDKFGRVLGDIVMSTGEEISQKMVDSLYAVRYYGQSKDDIESYHKEVRQRFFESIRGVNDHIVHEYFKERDSGDET